MNFAVGTVGGVEDQGVFLISIYWERAPIYLERNFVSFEQIQTNISHVFPIAEAILIALLWGNEQQ